MITQKGGFNLLSFLFILGVMALGYLVPRTSFIIALLVFSALFILYWILYQNAEANSNLKKLLLLAFILRILLLFSLPQWSEDYARFVWDGQLIFLGQNPYEFIPKEFISQSQLDSQSFLNNLYTILNSSHYHSVYPPSNQFVFWLAAMLADENLLMAVMIIRLILIGFEGLTIFLIYRLLIRLQMPEKRVLLYALNPLVIMEITGNLHFEGIMLAFILACIYLLLNGRHSISGAFLGTAVAVKLNPLMLAPIFFKWLSKSQRLAFFMAFILVLILGFAPLLLGNGLTGYFQSLGLYGNTFEFNASLYYLFREIGYWTHGYNLIGIMGPGLKWLTLMVIVGISFKVKKGNVSSLLENILLVYWVFFLFNTVVHPWYILPSLAISLFTEKKAFLVWSFLIFLSYQAYQSENYQESAWILVMEYLGVLLALFWDYSERFRRLWGKEY